MGKPGRSSSFEVTANGELIHSKLGGSGFVDDQKKLAALLAKIDPHAN